MLKQPSRDSCGLLSRDAGAAILTAPRGMEEDGVVETRAKAGGGLHSGEQYLISLERLVDLVTG